jgi:hypothetical protein
MGIEVNSVDFREIDSREDQFLSGKERLQIYSKIAIERSGRLAERELDEVYHQPVTLIRRPIDYYQSYLQDFGASSC